MRRRRVPDEDFHNRERWLISYADFITLLFGFFVVMYSISSVNEGKYQRLSESLEGVFSAPARAVQPIPIGDMPAQPRIDPVQPIVLSDMDVPREYPTLERIADSFASAFEDLVKQGVISVDRRDNWLEVTLPNSLLFGAGEAEPHYDAFDITDAVAAILAETDNAILVEGFTDNLPIRTDRYPSNWELSAARAATFVRMLAAEGVAPERMAAVGYGEYHPVARNDTPRGRRQNRRVVLLISADSDIRGMTR